MSAPLPKDTKELAKLMYQRSSVHSRHRKSIELARNAGQSDDVECRVGKLNAVMKDIGDMYDAFLVLVEEGSEEAIKLATWFGNLEVTHYECVKMASSWLQELRPKPLVEPPKGDGRSDAQFARLFDLPRVEIDSFSGDPLKYHSFMRSFEVNVEKVCSDPDARLVRLVSCTSGPARDAIRGTQIVGGDAGYKKAKEILHDQFGSDHLIVQEVIKGLRVEKVHSSVEQMRDFSYQLLNARDILQEMGAIGEVDAQSTIQELVNTLPNFAKNKWFERQMQSKRTKKAYLKFNDFVLFVSEIANDMADPICGQAARADMRASAKSKSERSKSERSFASSGSGEFKSATDHKGSSKSRDLKNQRPRNQAPACARCNEAHMLSRCNLFKAMSVTERGEFVAERRLCENCLRADHKVEECLSDNRCLVCKKKHSVFLHVDHQEANGITRSGNEAVFMPIVEVVVNDKKRIRAALDTCSSSTFCTAALANELSLKGTSLSYTLKTLQGGSKQTTPLVTLTISREHERMVLSGVKVVERIPITGARLDVSKYPHLSEIDMSANIGCHHVDLLIGQDCADALIPLAVKQGKPGEPFAVLYKFGWTLNGSTGSSKANDNFSVVSNFVTTLPMPDLQADLSKLWLLDHEHVREKTEMSVDERKVIDLWDNTCVMEHGHYVLPIPWKNPSEPLPNNFWLARKRLDSLYDRLRDQGLTERYDKEIESLITEGYAEVVPPDKVATATRIWYLPHHHVLNVNKPNKLRIVFDCACPCEGRSLNDRVLQGPDLVNSLYSILLGFRHHCYAIQADVKAMYHQVKVPVPDRDALRFLWYSRGSLIHLRMTSHLFGGVWCSAISTYALRRTVFDCVDADPLLARAVLDCTYVDDCLISLNDKAGALTIINDLPKLLERGGFVLTKFSANSRDLVDAIPIAHRAPAVHEFSKDSAGKALGVRWSVHDDAFNFVLSELAQSQNDALTRRTMLRVTASIYDPLGLVLPWVIRGKLLLRRATQLRLGWDEPVPQDLNEAWEEWLTCLRKVSSVDFARCIKPKIVDPGYCELHVFSDASEVAYGCCIYLRCVGVSGEVTVTLVAAKSYVAPIKQQTIPRLELHAASKAVALAASVRSELAVEIVHYWTDSMIVIGYISNETERFRTFVANRIGYIRAASDPRDWRHVRSRDNPADIVSRPQSVVDVQLWKEGPPWLTCHFPFWISEVRSVEIPADDPEVLSPIALLTDSVQGPSDPSHWLYRMIAHYSSWQRLYRAVTWVIKFVRFCLKSEGAERPTAQHFVLAQRLIVCHVQHECFPIEVKDPRHIRKSSAIYSLSPFVDKQGILRVGGRTGSHPILLSYDHRVSFLIAQHYHALAHSGIEWTLSLLREVFWIVKGRRLVRKVIDSCITCKRLFRKPLSQYMADLPIERISPDQPAFTFVGTDVFGPFHVVYRRSTVKRYGVIFTCMSSRAVHLEVVDTLEADSFLNAFRRFTARRGVPKTMFSDNGTNFIAAETELKQAWAKHRAETLYRFTAQKCIEWRFNPPSAPHMGGAWERLVGVIKRVLRAIMPANLRLTDEILSTTFCEAEAIVNARPLTKLSDDPDDLTPLSPNTLLLMRTTDSVPPGASCASSYRSRWKFVQHLANQFWSRFVKEYVVELNNRAKWAKCVQNLEVGELVIVSEKKLPRGLWPLGKIVEVHPGRDGKVRSVTVQTKCKQLKRPIVDLVRLELSVK